MMPPHPSPKRIVKTVLALAIAACLGLAAGQSVALDAISLDDVIAAQAEFSADECPLLTQIKYPFLRCVAVEGGSRALALLPAEDTWLNSRHVEGLDGVATWE